MKPIHYTLSVLLLASASLWAENNEGYKFETVVNQKVTPVKDQASTGTCWCFATTSFVEAELLRQGKGEYDLSEMFIVRQKYMNQLKDNFLRQGKGISVRKHYYKLDYGIQSGRHCTGRSLYGY